MAQPEKWPFHDAETGYKIRENLFYGFGDSGSMYVCDHSSRDDAIFEIQKLHAVPVDEIGTKPEQLGEMIVTVLSGREFVDRLKVIEPDNWSTIYGNWSE